jgi:hypothetical protein
MKRKPGAVTSYGAQSRQASSTHETSQWKTCTAGIAACKRQLQDLEAKADQLQQEHLGNRYKSAHTLANLQRHKDILEIIKQEEQKDSWSGIKRARGNPRTGATQKVQMSSRP